MAFRFSVPELDGTQTRANCVLHNREEKGLLPNTDLEYALVRAKNGDRACFAQIVCEHQNLVFSIARHSLGASATAEEIAQDIFLELFRNLRKIESPQHLVSWLRRSTVNRCIDHSRRLSTRSEVPLMDRLHPYAEGQTGDALLSESLRRHVSALPEWQRAVVVLRYQEDLDLAEIAETLAIPINTVKSRLHRALEALRDLLKEKKVANA